MYMVLSESLDVIRGGDDMGVKMWFAALLAGGIGGIAPDLDHLFGGRSFPHSFVCLGIMAILLCIGLYLTLSRRLS